MTRTTSFAATVLKWVVRHGNRPPHMRDRTPVVSQTILWILEVATDYIEKWFNRHNHTRLKGIEVVHGNQTRFHVPLVILEHLVVGLDMRQRNIVLTEHVPIQIGIFVPRFFVLIKP